MADKFRVTLELGLANVGFKVRRSNGGTLEYWNTSGTPAFEPYNAANIANYELAATEGAPGDWSVDVPATMPAGEIEQIPHVKNAASALTTTNHETRGAKEAYWNGTTLYYSGASLAAAIKAKTDNLPTDPADASDIAGALTAIDDFVDTEVAAIKAKTDLIGTAAASPLALRTGTAQAGASTTITLDAGASATTDFYVNCPILITGGTGAGQANWIKSYNGTTKVATLALPWIVNPDATSTFVLEYPTHGILRELLIADRTIDTATTPWSAVMKKHAASHELFRQRLFDVNGTNLLSEQTVPGRSIE